MARSSHYLPYVAVSEFLIFGLEDPVIYNVDMSSFWMWQSAVYLFVYVFIAHRHLHSEMAMGFCILLKVLLGCWDRLLLYLLDFFPWKCFGYDDLPSHLFTCYSKSAYMCGHLHSHKGVPALPKICGNTLIKPNTSTHHMQSSFSFCTYLSSNMVVGLWSKHMNIIIPPVVSCSCMHVSCMLTNNNCRTVCGQIEGKDSSRHWQIMIHFWLVM